MIFNPQLKNAMIYRVHLSDTNKLLSLPESGMGYQIIEARLTGSYILKKYVIYNSQLIVDLDDEFPANRQRITEKGFSTVLKESGRLDVKTDSIQLASRSIMVEEGHLIKYKKRHPEGRGATDNPEEYADGKEIFVRISAYEDDKRIDFSNYRLKEGTYTTTYKDYLDCVNGKDDPIDRYALPNDENIEWAFYIRPKSADVLQRGIVQPVFGHDGGGMEAFFKNGTSYDTYYKKEHYGK